MPGILNTPVLSIEKVVKSGPFWQTVIRLQNPSRLSTNLVKNIAVKDTKVIAILLAMYLLQYPTSMIISNILYGPLSFTTDFT